ncbi:MAG: hypothetical protein QF830_00565 [Rhodospirillales bacterium]|jgi:hypothetical protein|nr:hypothetical protein [Rhodospirillales bacterium]
MEADASRYRGVPGSDEIDWSNPRLDTRAAREHVAALVPEPENNRKTPKVISLSEPYERSRQERKKVEMLFAHLKRHMGFDLPLARGRVPPPSFGAVLDFGTRHLPHVGQQPHWIDEHLVQPRR